MADRPDVQLARCTVEELELQHNFIQMPLARPALGCADEVDRLTARIPAENGGHFVPADGHSYRLLIDEGDQSDLPEVTELSIEHRVDFDQEAIVVGRCVQRLTAGWQKLQSKFVGVHINWLFGRYVDSDFIVCFSLYLHAAKEASEQNGW